MGHERLADGQPVARVPKVVALLAAGGEIAANAGKDLSPGQGAEATGDLLLDLDHADILFALVVGERDRGIDEEGEDRQVIVF